MRDDSPLGDGAFGVTGKRSALPMAPSLRELLSVCETEGVFLFRKNLTTVQCCTIILQK